MIEIRHLKKIYDNVTPIEDLSVTINDGDVVSVIGPSGTGKSTFIRCINRLETPTSGEIIVDGVCVTDKKCNLNAVRRKMGMVFQSFNLFGNLTVLENVMVPQMDLLGVDKQTAYDKSMELLKMVGLDNKSLQYPDELSGGQKQRVAIARTLATDPDIILFDEPTSALDPTMVGEVQSVIRQLSEMGKTMIIVTHEMKFAREICNRVFYLDEGGLYEEGTPEEIFDHPKKEKTRRFIRKLKVFETTIERNSTDVIALGGEIDTYAQTNRIPYDIVDRVKSAVNILGAQILLDEVQLSSVELTVEYDETRLTAYVKFRYGGESFDPHNSQKRDEFSIVESYCSAVDYNWSEDKSANEVVLHIKRNF